MGCVNEGISTLTRPHTIGILRGDGFVVVNGDEENREGGYGVWFCEYY